MPFVNHYSNDEFNKKTAREQEENHAQYGTDNETSFRAHTKSKYLLKPIDEIINEELDIQMLMRLYDENYDAIYKVLNDIYMSSNTPIELRITDDTRCNITFNNNTITIIEYHDNSLPMSATVTRENFMDLFEPLYKEARALKKETNYSLLSRYASGSAYELGNYPDLNIFYPKLARETMRNVSPKVVSYYANIVEMNFFNGHVCILGADELIKLAETFNNSPDIVEACGLIYKIMMEDGEKNIGKAICTSQSSPAALKMVRIAEGILEDLPKLRGAFDNLNLLNIFENRISQMCAHSLVQALHESIASDKCPDYFDFVYFMTVGLTLEQSQSQNLDYKQIVGAYLEYLNLNNDYFQIASRHVEYLEHKKNAYKKDQS